MGEESTARPAMVTQEETNTQNDKTSSSSGHDGVTTTTTTTTTEGKETENASEEVSNIPIVATNKIKKKTGQNSEPNQKRKRVPTRGRQSQPPNQSQNRNIIFL